MPFYGKLLELKQIMYEARFKSISLLGLFATMLFAGSAEARRKRYYPSEPHNPNFMSSCTPTHSSVYNPNDGGSLEGGGQTRFGESINSIEDAARNGRPVSVSMDETGTFGRNCNRSSSRCLLLVHVPEIDKKFPAYARKFPNLPKDTILAIVEDRGDAFVGKGTGKLDIAIRSSRLALTGVGHRVGKKISNKISFEVIERVDKSKRKKNYTHFKPFIQGRESKCEIDAPRDRNQEKSEPMVSAPKDEIIQVADEAEDRVAPEKPAVRPKKKAHRVAAVQYRPRKEPRQPSAAEIFFANLSNSAP